ncbi:MAG: sugar ABC transporter ATP-binding protein [Cyanobacteria bacterium]|nr:sugar ABC transporter ATP-binding protein [Cyanobacteriota bacterium]
MFNYKEQDMKNDFLVMRNVSKSFYGVKALKNVDLTIRRGEIHGLVGENGSGKSTLVKIISGILQADENSVIEVDGFRYQKYNTNNTIQKGIQVIYQDPSIFPNLTVAENIAFNKIIEKGTKFINWKEITRIAKKAMDRIKIELYPDTLVGDLSLANQMLIAICRVITTNSKLIIMDEPTSALTSNEVDLLFRVIRILIAEGLSILFISHKINEVLEITDRVTVLRDGEKVGTYETKDLNYNEITYLMSNKKITESRYIFNNEDKEVLIEVKNISKKDNYKDICFKLYKGEILGISGLLGSGRTEVALTLFGMNIPDKGEILIDNKPVIIKSPIEAIKLGIGYVPEDRILQGLIMEESIGNNMVITILNSLLNRLKLINNRKKENTINYWTDKLKIKCTSSDDLVKTLSGGNQQRVVLAKWLVKEPKIFILDCPTAGIDVAAKDEIHKIIRKSANHNINFILISDEEEELLNNCNRILTMHKGRIVKDFIVKDDIKKRIN